MGSRTLYILCIHIILPHVGAVFTKGQQNPLADLEDSFWWSKSIPMFVGSCFFCSAKKAHGMILKSTLPT